MKILKTLWALLPLFLGFVVYFGYLRTLPVMLSLVLFIVFCIVWFCRKQIADTIISKLKHIPQLDHFLWDDAGQKKDENGKLSQDRKPIESNIRLIKLGVNAAILLVFLGVPMLILGIIGMFGGIFDLFAESLEILGQDLSFMNGFGFFVFAIFEILVTLTSLAFIVLALVRGRNGSWTGKKAAIIAGLAFLVQRVFSWFYFGSTVAGAFGEILFWALLIAIFLVCKRFDIIGKIRALRGSRPVVVDPDDVVDAEDFVFDDDDDFDPLGGGSADDDDDFDPLGGGSADDDDDFVDPI